MITPIFLIILLVGILWMYARYLRFRKRPYYHPLIAQWKENAPDLLPRPDYSLILIGDAGAPNLAGEDEVFHLLTDRLEVAGENSTVVFLGDNAYPRGLPPEGERVRKLAEKRLDYQISRLKDINGNIYFLSGNHDWNRGRRNGWEYVVRQEEYIETRMGRGNVYLPDNGCPGPVEIVLKPSLTMIIINTQWWAQNGFRPAGEEFGCGVKSEEEFFEQFSELINRNRQEGKHVLVAAHHPLYSNSEHGGKFPIKHHFFPLTALGRRLYIPLPGAGSLYPYYRKFIGAREDMSHPRYKRLRKRLLKILNGQHNIVYAAGHDHNLQYFLRKENHYLVSGAGSKTTYVKRGPRAMFVHTHKGFCEISYHGPDCWLDIWEPGMVGAPVLALRRKLYTL